MDPQASQEPKANPDHKVLPARLVIQRILDRAVINFERGTVERAKDSLIFIIEWFKRVHEYAEMEPEQKRLNANRSQLLIASLEIMQRELKVLARLVDNTLAS